MNITHSPAYLAESKVAIVNTMFIIPIPLEVLSTVWRLWATARAPRRPGHRLFAFDDYLMIVATVLGIFLCVWGVVYGGRNGLGRHIEALPQENINEVLKGDYIFSHIYNVTIIFTKLSVLAVYYRLFITPKFRFAVIGTSTFTVVWVIVMEFVLGFGCQPIEGWWNEGPRTKCINKESATYIINVTDLILDVWIFLMPIIPILNLKTSLDKKVSLCFLFSMGLGTCAVTAARLKFVFGVASYDITWEECTLGTLLAWEPCGAILCANTPFIYRHLVRVRDKFIVKVKGSAASQGSNPPVPPAGSQQPSNGLTGHRHEWTRLNSSKLNNEIPLNINHTVTWISADRSSRNSAELEQSDMRGIMVHTGFRRDSVRSLPETTDDR